MGYPTTYQRVAARWALAGSYDRVPKLFQAVLPPHGLPSTSSTVIGALSCA
jgi:hypothetical protein